MENLTRDMTVVEVARMIIFLSSHNGGSKIRSSAIEDLSYNLRYIRKVSPNIFDYNVGFIVDGVDEPLYSIMPDIDSFFGEADMIIVRMDDALSQEAEKLLTHYNEMASL